jgi:hypothetical protein
MRWRRLATSTRPLLALLWIESGWSIAVLPRFTLVLLDAAGNGSTIAISVNLMEISPEDRRPAYSGYFNALAAPVAFLPLAGAAIVALAS